MNRPRLLVLLVSAAAAVAACGLSVTGVEGDAAIDAGPDRVAPNLDAGGGEVDGASPSDAGRSDAADADASPPSLFGGDCPADTVYEDDFTRDPSSTWRVVSGEWTWNEAQKTYSVARLPANGTEVGIIWLGPRPNWRNYDVEVEQEITELPDAGHSDLGPIFRVREIPQSSPQRTDDGSMYLAATQLNTNDTFVLSKFENGGYERFEGLDSNVDPTARHTIHATATGDVLRTWLNTNDTTRISRTNDVYATGSVGIRVFRAGATLHRIRVTCR